MSFQKYSTGNVTGADETHKTAEQQREALLNATEPFEVEPVEVPDPEEIQSQ